MKMEIGKELCNKIESEVLTLKRGNTIWVVDIDHFERNKSGKIQVKFGYHSETIDNITIEITADQTNVKYNQHIYGYNAFMFEEAAKERSEYFNEYGIAARNDAGINQALVEW